MAAVTQRVSNYLGGVSRQSDDKKLPNQVVECLNGYPDPTFGLTKRPGFKWITNLGTGTTYDNCKWFYIHRDNDERYIGCIKPALGEDKGDIDIWNATTGAVCNVTYGTGAQDYLTGTRTNYDILTVQDTSIITNNLQPVETLDAPSYKLKSKAALVLTGPPLGKYNVTISNADGTGSQTMAEIEATSNNFNTYDLLLDELEAKINALNDGIADSITVTKYDDALHLDGGTTEFKITASGGANNDKLHVVQDIVDNVSELPFNSVHGRTVKIINTESQYDTYWAKFVAEDGTSGRGYWEETVDPTLSTGFKPETMPHELINPSTNVFTFRQISWTPRKVGDDITNPHPSFVGAKIQQAFFHNSRLGFLSTDNVALSQTQDFYNFYAISAQTQTDSDPVDLSCSAIRPAALHGVIPTTQGLVLFSQNQQFLMASGNGILTPSTTTIRTISNYEMDTNVDPVDMGTNINFISKTPSYTRVFGMVTRGQDENPQVLDVGRVVNEWIPAGIDTFIASPQNQFLALSSQSDDKIYFYRTYSDGKENILEAWFNWQLMGNVQGIAVDSDDMYTVTKQGDQFTLSVASLSQSPSDAIIVNNDGSKINPCMDLYTTASNAAADKKVDWDSTNRFSKCYIPWNNVTGLSPVIVIKGTTATGQFTESGFTATPTVVTDDGDPYFKVEGKNLKDEEDNVIVGWKYDLDVILPRTYVRTDERQKSTDYTATLTVARMKFAVGLSGVMGFKLKSTGTRQGEKRYIGYDLDPLSPLVVGDLNWVEEDISYVDRDQIKVRINNNETTDFTFKNDTTINITSVPQQVFNNNPAGHTFTWTFDRIDMSKIVVQKETGVGTGIYTTQTLNTDYRLSGKAEDKTIVFVNSEGTPTDVTQDVKVRIYSADDIVIYLDEWYNLSPTILANNYLANDIGLTEPSIFTVPIHQKTDNFQLRVFNDSPFPVSLNSMMWEGNYSPRFYRRF